MVLVEIFPPRLGAFFGLRLELIPGCLIVHLRYMFQLVLVLLILKIHQK